MQPPSNPPGRRSGEKGGGGSVKGCALRNRANIYVTESCRPTKKVFWVSKERKKKFVAERESVRFRKGARGRETGVARGGEDARGGEGERRRIMKTTMGERARLKLAQFCSRRRARTTTTMAVVVAAQYRV